MLLEALKGLASLPKLIEAVERIGDKLDEKQAQERLDSKRARNRAAIPVSYTHLTLPTTPYV